MSIVIDSLNRFEALPQVSFSLQVSFWGILGLFGLSQDRAHPDITLNRRGFAEDEAHRGRASGCLPSHK
jgi:hypothetical protein